MEKSFLGGGLFFGLALTLAVLLTGCSTPQEKSGVNPKPFNSPTSWERNPYGDGYFRN